MRIYLQWAKDTAEDWQPIEVTTSAVRKLPRKSVPSATSSVDGVPGWLCALNCQGIVFSGWDHTAIEVIGDSLAITGWQDDTEDFGDTRWATRWLLSPPAPDPRLGGRMNTVQQRTDYATADLLGEPWLLPDVRPWEEFSPPPDTLTLHGVWLPDNLFQQHVAARTTHGWREWA